MKLRKEIPSKDQWKVEALFRTLSDWQAAYSAFSCEPILAFQKRLGESPLVLKEALDTLFTLSRELEKLHTYAHLRHDEDIADTQHKEAYQKATMLFADFQEKTSWMEPELLSLSDKTLEQFLAAEVLRPYRFYLEKMIRLKPHTLSRAEEQLLAMASLPLQTAAKAFGALNNADLKLGKIKDGQRKTHELTHGLYQLYLRSADRTLRKQAFLKMHGTFKGVENTVTELLFGQVQQHVFHAKARGYASSLEAALFPKNIPLSVYHNLIRTVRSHLPSLHRYVELRKERLKLKKIYLYDMYVPLVEEDKSTLSYEESERLVIDSVAPLGKHYQETLKRGLLQERWVDRFENANKRSGAYSSGCYDSYPYILMNYKGILRDTFTLAHEVGHSMHSLLSHQNQAYHDSHYPIFVAEVASTFNEELLMQWLLAHEKSEKRRLCLVHEKVEDIRATLFRQTMFAEFELKIHECVEKGTPLTPKLLSELYLQLNRDYFGPAMTLDEPSAIEWARIPHFYYNFYVYQYATGIAAALALSKHVLSGDAKARENYLTFLKGGCHLFPIDLLKLAGIDMTSSAPITAALEIFDSLVTKLENFLT